MSGPFRRERVRELEGLVQQLGMAVRLLPERTERRYVSQLFDCDDHDFSVQSEELIELVLFQESPRVSIRLVVEY